MKLILAIVNKSDTKDVVKAMMKEGFSVTRLASGGGFLKGDTMVTLISVVMCERLETALNVLRKTCRSRVYDTSRVAAPHRAMIEENHAPGFEHKEVVVGGANVFVLNVEETHKF